MPKKMDIKTRALYFLAAELLPTRAKLLPAMDDRDDDIERVALVMTDPTFLKTDEKLPRRKEMLQWLEQADASGELEKVENTMATHNHYFTGRKRVSKAWLVEDVVKSIVMFWTDDPQKLMEAVLAEDPVETYESEHVHFIPTAEFVYWILNWLFSEYFESLPPGEPSYIVKNTKKETEEVLTLKLK